MKTITTHFLFFFFSLLLLQSCVISSERIRGNGQITNQEISISDYHEIKLYGSADIVYEQKSEKAPYIQLCVDENILPYLDVKSEGGKLIIKTRNNVNIQPSRFTIYTNSRSLDYIGIPGSGDVYLKGEVNSKDMKVNISGSGEIRTDSLYCEKLSIDVTGSGKAKLFGSVNEASISVSGSGDIKSFGMPAKAFSCEITGSGNVETFVSESLNVRVSGSGDLKYKGNPKNVNQKISGSGSVKKVG